MEDRMYMGRYHTYYQIVPGPLAASTQTGACHGCVHKKPEHINSSYSWLQQYVWYSTGVTKVGQKCKIPQVPAGIYINSCECSEWPIWNTRVKNG